MTAWLRRNGLPLSLVPILTALGVTTIGDLQYLREVDLAAMGVPLITRRRLLAVAQPAAPAPQDPPGYY